MGKRAVSLRAVNLRAVRTKANAVRMVKRALIGAAISVLVIGAGCASKERFQRAATASERAAGDTLATKIIDQLGGADAYNALSYVAFDFVASFGGIEAVRQRHEWDKQNGRHKLIRQDGEHRTEIYTDLWDRYVVVMEDGKRVTDEEKVKTLGEEAYAAFINDTYWLVAPFKLFDEGVSRAAVEGGLRLSFGDGIGLTSGDVYVFEVDETGKLTGWSFVLESGISASFDFVSPQRVGGVTFHKTKATTAGQIDFGTIVGFPVAPPGAFAPLMAHRS